MNFLNVWRCHMTTNFRKCKKSSPMHYNWLQNNREMKTLPGPYNHSGINAYGSPDKRSSVYGCPNSGLITLSRSAPIYFLRGDCVPNFVRLSRAHTVMAGKCTLGRTLPHSKCYDQIISRMHYYVGGTT